MAARVKVKASDALSPELLEFFDDLTGSGAVNLQIVAPKAREIREIGLALSVELGDLATVLSEYGYAKLSVGVTTLTEDILVNFDGYFCAPDLSAKEEMSKDKPFRV